MASSGLPDCPGCGANDFRAVVHGWLCNRCGSVMPIFAALTTYPAPPPAAGGE